MDNVYRAVDAIHRQINGVAQLVRGAARHLALLQDY